MDTTYIETDRLILRSWKMSDRDVFAEMNSNDNVMKYFPKPLSIEESNGFVDSINSEFEETGFGLYAVEIRRQVNLSVMSGSTDLLLMLLFHRDGK